MRTGPSVRLCLLHLLWTLTAATTAPSHSLQAREPWTGIVKPTNGNPPETTGPWPADPIMPGRHSVRYCWVSEDDYVELNDYVQKAIGLWQPAIGPEKALYSSLNFRPDGGKQQENILCKDASPDALHISVIPESAPYTTASSIGYQPAEEDDPGGNHMRILTKLPDMPDEAERRKARIVAVVAHELGHVIGLGHEFQRPDRDEYLSFYCRNLKDYEAVKEKLEPGDTMEKACTDFHIAKKYKFSAMEWMPHRGGYIESIMPIAWSHTFDPISIMMYGSFAGSPNLVRKKSTAVMLAKKTKGARPNPEDEVLVSSGGAPFDTTGLEWSHLCKLSEGDMARTAQLYPTKGPKGKEDPGNVRANNPKWVGSTVKQPARPVGA